MTITFTQLQLHPHLIQTIENSGFTQPTPIQEQSIPHIMAGGDVMACAQTGTGKTAAFTLPVAHRLLSTKRDASSRSSAPRAVVLAPTRELADQVLNSIKSFIKGSPLKAGLIVGGVSYKPQIQMLRRPLDIIVATPGRFIDHMEDGRIDLSQVEVVILDEADRMLDMGFVKPVEKIVSIMPKKRQTLLFSATFDTGVKKLAKQFLKDPTQISLAPATKKHDNITQSMFHVTTNEEKAHLLQGMLEDPNIWQAIVFMRTKHAADRLAKKVAGWGHESAALHGDMRQSARKRVIEQMYKGKVRVLVATDVAARGLDVKELTHVINFDLPQVSEDYVHRIGRTGRAGAKGTAYSYVNKADASLLRDIEKMLGHKIDEANERPKAAPKTDGGKTLHVSSGGKKKGTPGAKFKKTRGSKSNNPAAPNKPGSKKKAWSNSKKSASTQVKVKDTSEKSENKSAPKKAWSKDEGKRTSSKSWSKDAPNKSRSKSSGNKSWSKDSSKSEGNSASTKSWKKGSSQSEGKSNSSKTWSKDSSSTKVRAKKSGGKSWSKGTSGKPGNRSEGFKGKGGAKRGAAPKRPQNRGAQA